MQIHGDIAANLHRIVADTLHANLQQKLQVQIKNPLYIYMGKQFTHFSQQKPTVYLWRKCVHAQNHVCTKKCLHIQFTQF